MLLIANFARLPLLAAQGNARSARAGRKGPCGRKDPTRPSMREHVPSKSFGGGKRRSRDARDKLVYRSLSARRAPTNPPRVGATKTLPSTTK